jgi:hypothetical protein
VSHTSREVKVNHIHRAGGNVVKALTHMSHLSFPDVASKLPVDIAVRLSWVSLMEAREMLWSLEVLMTQQPEELV